MRVERRVDVPIHNGTLTDLLVSNYLRTFANFKLKDDEEVIKLELSPPNKDGVRMIRFMFIEEREPAVLVLA